MERTKLVRNFAKGERVIYALGTPCETTIEGYAPRTPFDPRANYRVNVRGRVRTVNEHWLQKA